MTTVALERSWDRRRLLYGDWTWLVRDPLDVMRLAFLGGTIAFAAAGNPDAAALTAASAVLLIARVVDLPRWFDFGLIVAMTAIGYGTAFSLYGYWFYYDKVVHSLSPIGYAPVLYIVLVRLGVVPDPGDAIRERRVARISGIFIVTLALGMAVGAGYESVEWIEDKFDILGGHFVKGLWDTETDLLCDTCGSLIGATFLTVWSLRGWSSRRVTVVPAPRPKQPIAATAAERLRADAGRAPWPRRLAGLPLAAQGLAGLIAGAVLLALPSPNLRNIGIALGAALLALAGFEVVELLRGGAQAEVGAGIARIAAETVVGTLVLAWPAISQLALLYAVGAFSILLAITEAASLASDGLSTRERWLGGITSVAALIFGLAMLARPARSLHAAVTLVGLYLVVLGVQRLVRAVEARRDRASVTTG